MSAFGKSQPCNLSALERQVWAGSRHGNYGREADIRIKCVHGKLANGSYADLALTEIKFRFLIITLDQTALSD